MSLLAAWAHAYNTHKVWAKFRARVREGGCQGLALGLGLVLGRVMVWVRAREDYDWD